MTEIVERNVGSLYVTLFRTADEWDEVEDDERLKCYSLDDRYFSKPRDLAPGTVLTLVEDDTHHPIFLADGELVSIRSCWYRDVVGPVCASDTVVRPLDAGSGA